MSGRVRGIRILFVVGAILASVATQASADWGPSEVQVFCYAGDRSNEEYLGTVDVYSLNNPAANCNVMYSDCNGNCTACYDDQSAREVCVSSSGAAYYY